MAEQVTREVQSVEGVLDCHRVRVRPSGPHYFVDFHVTMDGSRTLESAHALVEVVEARVQRLLPGSDVTVHVDPTSAVPWLRDPPPEKTAQGKQTPVSQLMEGPMPEPKEGTEGE